MAETLVLSGGPSGVWLDSRELCHSDPFRKLVRQCSQHVHGLATDSSGTAAVVKTREAVLYT